MTAPYLIAIQDSTLARLVSKSDHLVGAALQVVHVLGLLILLAALILTVLRLQGWAFKDNDPVLVLPPVRRLWWIGLAAVSVSGLLMFISAAALYGSKPVFALKLLLFALAVLMQVLLFRRQGQAGTVLAPWLAPASWAALGLWLSVAAAGRAIGFV